MLVKFVLTKFVLTKDLVYDQQIFRKIVTQELKITHVPKIKCDFIICVFLFYWYTGLSKKFFEFEEDSKW